MTQISQAYLILVSISTQEPLALQTWPSISRTSDAHFRSSHLLAVHNFLEYRLLLFIFNKGWWRGAVTGDNKAKRVACSCRPATRAPRHLCIPESHKISQSTAKVVIARAQYSRA